MSYILCIQRSANTPITLAEWEAAVKQTAGIRGVTQVAASATCVPKAFSVCSMHLHEALQLSNHRIRR